MSAVFYENKAQNGCVKSIFKHLDSLVYAADELKREGYLDDMIVTTPLPRHDVEHVLYEGRPSPIRWFTLAGALFGGTFGFTLQSITHLNWSMVIPAGKPLVSIPAFMVITFESTVLWGCLFTLVGMLIHCRLPARNNQHEIKDPRLSDDKFAIVVNNLSRDKAAKATEILKANGAMQVINGYDIERAPEIVKVDAKEVGWEPDETDTNTLMKLAIAVTIFIILSFVGVKMYFDSEIKKTLNEQGYTYSKRAVAPSYRNVK